MPANTELLLSTLETKAQSITTSSSTSDILKLVNSIRRIGYSNSTYASSDDLPTANSSFKGMTAYAVANATLFICNGDAWHNVFANTAPSGGAGGSEPYTFQGSNYGYSTNGHIPLGYNYINKFPFTSDGNATDIGDLSSARYGPAGQSSSDYGYSSGGWHPTDAWVTIDKFPFTSDGNATDVGDLTVARRYTAGQSSSDYGYTSGGDPASNVIDKFPFSADGNATDVGDLTVAKGYLAGQSSADYGYVSGGTPPDTNVIEKFPFASDGNATSVGYLTVPEIAASARFSPAGQSSTDYGYNSGGYRFSTINVIEKFPFASDGNASDVGDLAGSYYNNHAGQQY